MKANLLLTGCLALAVLGACAPRAVPPAAAPPPPAQTPPPLPRPVPVPAADWRDAPLTPGAWRWSQAGQRSTASFALSGQPPLVQIVCAEKGTIQLFHAATAATPVPLGVTASAGTFALMSDAQAASAGTISVTMPARSPVLDAMAVSRGRFVIEVAGTAPSYLPTRPEVARVIEDCR